MMDEYEDFREELQQVYNDSNVQKADYFIPEVPEYKYLHMGSALTCGGEGP